MLHVQTFSIQLTWKSSTHNITPPHLSFNFRSEKNKTLLHQESISTKNNIISANAELKFYNCRLFSSFMVQVGPLFIAFLLKFMYYWCISRPYFVLKIKNCREHPIYHFVEWHFFSLIRHIAITNCPFRFAFSHLPKCGQLLRQKDRNNFAWNLCARFS